jgi:hypothetical protein
MKNTGILIIIMVLAVTGIAHASVTVVTPNSSTVLDQGQFFDYGNIEAGDQFTLTIANEISPETEVTWQQLRIDTENLPSGWKVKDSSIGGKVLTATITVPQSQEKNAFNIKAIAVNEGKGLEAGIQVRVYVRKDLVEADVTNTLQETFVKETATFQLTLINNSVAEKTVIVSSTLPTLWIPQKTVMLAPNEVKTVSLDVIPRVYGWKNFEFKVENAKTQAVLDIIPVTLNVKPLLKEKYEASLYGFPFYSVSLLPYYLINSFLSLLIP